MTLDEFYEIVDFYELQDSSGWVQFLGPNVAATDKERWKRAATMAPVVASIRRASQEMMINRLEGSPFIGTSYSYSYGSMVPNPDNLVIEPMPAPEKK